MDCKRFKRILILKPEGGLGDEVVFSPVYRELKKNNPKLNISVFAYGTSAVFLRGNKYIDNLYTAKFRCLRYHQRWPTMIYWGIKLAARKFDAVLDMDNWKQKNWAMFRLLASRFKYRAVKFDSPEKHRADTVNAFLKALGIENPDMSYDLPLPQESMNKISALSQDKPYLVLNPFGRTKDRVFSDETLEIILSRVNRFGTRRIIIPYLTVAPKINVTPNARLFHTKDPFDLIALVYKSGIVITPDTSVVHIAAGFQKKTIAFYNNPDCSTWLPNNCNAIVVKTDKSSVNKFDIKEFEEAYKKIIN